MEEDEKGEVEGGGATIEPPDWEGFRGDLLPNDTPNSRTSVKEDETTVTFAGLH